MVKKRLTVLLALAGIMSSIILIGMTGCTNKSGQTFDITAISSYREIPGITNEEIAAIEALKERRQGFSLWQMLSTEGFILPDGTHAGFSPKFCNLLSDIFEIPFTLKFNNNEAVDFTYEFVINPEQLKKNISISSPIIQRSLAVITYGSRKIEVPDDLNGLKIGILHDSAIANLIATAYPYLKFEIIPIPNTAAEAGMLKRGEVDAIIGISTRMAYDYDNTDFTCIYNLLPFAFIPVGLASANTDLEPVISILDKYIAAGGISKIYKLYKEGDYEYKRHIIYQSFSGEEKEYVDNHITNKIKVPVVLESDSYPISFYNEKEKTFQGIAPDILAEISSLTSIEFKIINDKNATWSELQEMLRTGEAAIVSELLYTKEREEYFIWTATPYFSSPFAFISRADYPFLDIPQIAQTSIGIVRDTYYENMYRRWFPGSNNIVLYDFQDEALDALGRGEIDLVFTSEYILLYQLNYREKSGFKTNFVFSAVTSSLFGFNKNEEILCSIIGKAMPYTRMEIIKKDWLSKVYDYSRIIERVRFVIVIIFAVLILLVLIIIAILLFTIVKKRRIIAQQTDILQEALEKSFIANKTVEYERMKYQLVIESMDIALWEMEVISPDMENPPNSGKWIWSEEFRNILGFTSENDFPNTIESFFKCIHPEDAEKAVDAFNNHFRDRSGKTPYSIEYRLRHKNGEYLYFDGFGTTLRDSEGFPIRISGAIRNVTEIKEANEALKKHDNILNAVNRAAGVLLTPKASDDFNKSLLEGMKIVGHGVDVDCVEIWHNETIDGELYAVLKHIWFNDKVPSANIADVSQSFSYSSTPDWENRLLRGEYIKGPLHALSPEDQDFVRPFGLKSLLAIPVFVEDRFWGICCIDDYSKYRDFSEDEISILRSCSLFFVNAIIRNNMFQKIQKTSSELMLQKTTLQTIIDSIPEPIFCKDLELKYTLINTTGRKFLNLDINNIVGKDDSGVGFPNNVSKKMQWADHKILNGDKIVMYDDWLPSGNGEARYFETIKAPIMQDEAIVGIVGMSRDITEKMQMEKTLSAALEQANAASKAKSNFLSTMSHEMRTPMNAIIGMTAIGKKSNNIEEKNHALNKIEGASNHLLGVINDVLDIAKIEANKLELTPVEFNFEKVIQRVVSVVNFRVDEKKQRLSTNIDSNIPDFLIGDDQRLAQVVTNLLANAIKFTPIDGEILFCASLICEKDDECELCIEVQDSGRGIALEQQKKLFDMFEQAESGISREYGGTGLGLAISKNIVELMGGKIWVESELGKGARFIFTIKTKRGTKNLYSLLSEDVNWNNVRILVVDDVAEVHIQFRDIFDNLNIKCDTAFDGDEACRMIEEHGEYDIYFIDWRMPGMNGIELSKKIKNRINSRKSVIIMITAMDWEQIKDDAGNAGVDKHLLKPLSPSMVIDCINECLSTSVNGEQKYIAGEFTDKKMLLAEDIEINREILLALLKDTGIQIDCAENGNEALEAVKAAPNKYDIIFMDVQMPKMDGLEATRRIRALPDINNSKLPIIAMTANVFKDDIEKCLAAGMDAHLGKPLDIDKILETMRKYLV
ncbi:MAG: response regulator [Treponema sp.]|nr:response regulator [Treponema sp.]